MKKLLILSGKGGTGKTTTCASFIKFANAKAFADCDVDAPNLHIVCDLTSNGEKSHYYGSQKSFIQEEKCIQCGKCFENCRFDAIKKCDDKYIVDQYACEGCGVCNYVCPTKAVNLTDDVAGNLTLYKDEAVFSTAKLKMGRGNSGKLVTAVKTALSSNANLCDLAIIDGSPGIGCPVIASISGVNLVLIVAEPSVSGISDMERIVKTAGIFQTKIAVCVNKYDTNIENTDKIQDFCQKNNIPFVGKIPFDKQASVAINSGKTLADIDCEATKALRDVYDKTIKLI